MTDHLGRPGTDEYHEFYGRYIDLVPDGSIVETLAGQMGDTLALLQEIPPEQELHRYAPDKWTIRGVVGHVIDVERGQTYRALTFARESGVDLPGMDPEQWGRNSNADERPLEDLGAEWAALRRSTVHFFATLGPDTAKRTGTANGSPFTVRAFPWIIAGHELWHREKLVSDYGVSGTG